MQFYPSIKLSLAHPPLNPLLSELEISGLFDGLSAIEELAPDATWDDLLSASWGLPIVPTPMPVSKSPMALFIVALSGMVTSLRQMFARVQAS
jgi:hypothetical protein